MNWRKFVENNERVQAPARVLKFNKLFKGGSDLDTPTLNELDYSYMGDYEEKWFD